MPRHLLAAIQRVQPGLAYLTRLATALNDLPIPARNVADDIQPKKPLLLMGPALAESTASHQAAQDHHSSAASGMGPAQKPLQMNALPTATRPELVSSLEPQGLRSSPHQGGAGEAAAEAARSNDSVHPSAGSPLHDKHGAAADCGLSPRKAMRHLQADMNAAEGDETNSADRREASGNAHTEVAATGRGQADMRRSAANGVATPPASVGIAAPSTGAGASEPLLSPDSAALNVFSNPLYSVAR